MAQSQAPCPYQKLCPPGDGGGGSADCHDNNFSYTWCTSITPGPQTVQLKLASFPGGDGNTAFYERAHIYIDGTPNPEAPDACVAATPVM